MTFAHLALWLLVLALGIQTGAGLFETRVLVPLWASDPPATVLAYMGTAIRPDSGRRLWMILTPLTGIISLINIVAAWQSHAAERSAWLFASFAAVAVIVVTFAYFVPVLFRLPRAAEMPPQQVAGMVRWWVRLNWLRFALLAAAWIAALEAFSHGA